jgi:hypothetical protein
MSEEVTLKDVVDRLDQLITLWKLANMDVIRKVRKEIENDPVSMKVLELADGTKEYSLLAKEVAKSTGKSEITVKRRIAELSDKWGIKKIRKGKRVYYKDTGLYE